MKKLIVGIIIGIVIGSMITVGAANLIAVYPTFDVYVDGQLFTPEDKPVVINSRTYLPLRATSDALNVPITWNEEGRCVFVKTDEVRQKQIVYDKTGAKIIKTDGTTVITGETPSEDEGFKPYSVEGKEINISVGEFVYASTVYRSSPAYQAERNNHWVILLPLEITNKTKNEVIIKAEEINSSTYKPFLLESNTRLDLKDIAIEAGGTTNLRLFVEVPHDNPEFSITIKDIVLEF